MAGCLTTSSVSTAALPQVRRSVVRSGMSAVSAAAPQRHIVSTSLSHSLSAAPALSGSRSSTQVDPRFWRRAVVTPNRWSSTVTQAGKQTFTNFEEMVALSDTVLVDFYALWCGPCQLMNGVLQDVSNRAGDSLRIVKIDTEKYPVLASDYKVEALPTFILFHKGKAVDRVEGAISADKLLARIDSAIAAATSP